MVQGGSLLMQNAATITVRVFIVEKVENQKNHWWWCPWTDFQPASCVSSKWLCEKNFPFCYTRPGNTVILFQC
jgi:hypothetical protein